MSADEIRTQAIEVIAREWYSWWRTIYDGHSTGEHPAPLWDEVPDTFGPKQEWLTFAAGGVDALAAAGLLPTSDWEPGRWYRVRQPDGSLWLESSDRAEACRESERTGWPMEQIWDRRESVWREVAE